VANDDTKLQVLDGVQIDTHTPEAPQQELTTQMKPVGQSVVAAQD